MQTIGEIASFKMLENFRILEISVFFNWFLFQSEKKKKTSFVTYIEFHLNIVQIERNKFFNGLLSSFLSPAHFILSTFPILFYQPPTRIPYRKKRNKTFLFQSFPLHSAKFLNRPTISLSLYPYIRPYVVSQRDVVTPRIRRNFEEVPSIQSFLHS